jgi:hypothetical protein
VLENTGGASRFWYMERERMGLHVLKKVNGIENIILVHMEWGKGRDRRCHG